MTDVISPRRGFLARIGTGLLALAATPTAAMASARLREADEAWLHGLNGKHKQFFDTSAFRDGRPLSRVSNFLDVYAEAYGLGDTDLSAVVGMHGSGLGFGFSDALWAKYDLGKRWAVNDPLTSAPATRNPMTRKEPAYDWSVDYSVSALQRRGVRFIACMRSIRGLSMEIAGSRSAAGPVNADILANLLPGVTPVPAMIVATNRAQEAGLAYVFA